MIHYTVINRIFCFLTRIVVEKLLDSVFNDEEQEELFLTDCMGHKPLIIKRIVNTHVQIRLHHEATKSKTANKFLRRKWTKLLRFIIRVILAVVVSLTFSANLKFSVPVTQLVCFKIKRQLDESKNSSKRKQIQTKQISNFIPRFLCGLDTANNTIVCL